MFHKGAELGPILLLDINRKQYMGSRITPSRLTLNDIERSNSRSQTFRGLLSRKGAYLRNMLLLNIDRKPYMGRPTF